MVSRQGEYRRWASISASEQTDHNIVELILSKGQLIDDSSTFKLFLFQHLIEGEPLSSRLKLYTTAQDVAPDWRTDHTVEGGDVITKFSSRDIAEAKSRWNPELKKMVRRFEYGAIAKVQTENSSLSFETYAYGKKAGKATFWMDLG